MRSETYLRARNVVFFSVFSRFFEVFCEHFLLAFADFDVAVSHDLTRLLHFILRIEFCDSSADIAKRLFLLLLIRLLFRSVGRERVLADPSEMETLTGAVRLVVLFPGFDVAVLQRRLDARALEFDVHLLADFHGEVVMPPRALHDVRFER